MTKWHYALLDYECEHGTIGVITYGAGSSMNWNADREAAFEAARQEGLLEVLDFLGGRGWEMAGSAFDKEGHGRFIFKRPATAELEE